MSTDDALDLSADVVTLTAALVDIPSVSGEERRLADAVEVALRRVDGLVVERCGDAVLARTELGRDQRVVLAGHLDTVPVADNLPSRLDGDLLHGCGTTDMKSGDAVMLRLAATLADPVYDVTYLFYDNEEVEAPRNGLGRVARELRHWLYGDLAILLEPTGGELEAGCQGTLRATVTTTGRRAHSARAWLGSNAIHAAAPILSALAEYQPEVHTIDGLTYREGLNAVRVSGGVAGNVIPDLCEVTVNFRYAPDRTTDDAEDFVRRFFVGYGVEVTDNAGGALPGLSAPATRAFVEAVGSTPVSKEAWTDVSRFAAFKIPAINYGPGDPALAHTREEYVETARIVQAERVLREFLTRRTA